MGMDIKGNLNVNFEKITKKVKENASLVNSAPHIFKVC